MSDKKCVVCKGNGIIKLLGSQCPFCNGTGEYTKSAESYLDSHICQCIFLDRKICPLCGKKKFMGREYMGVFRSTFLVNDKGKIFKIYPKVKAAGHSKEVLDAFSN